MESEREGVRVWYVLATTELHKNRPDASFSLIKSKYVNALQIVSSASSRKQSNQAFQSRT